MRHSRTAGIVCLAALALGGCAETLVIHSYPAGARATVNGAFVGVTPATLEVPKDQLRDEYRWVVEKEHYRPVEGLVKPRIAPGRIVGAVFTLGILLAFRSPTYLPAVSVELEPMPVAAASPEALEQRLEKVERLHEKGLLSDQEYKRLRGQLLDELRGAQP